MNVRTHRRPDGRVIASPTAPWTADQARSAIQYARSERVTVIAHVPDDRPEDIRTLADAGFTAARREVKVEVDLDQALAAVGAPPLPHGVAAISAADADLERLRLLDDALREEIPGTAGWRSTPAEFAEETLDQPAFNPATYLVAVDELTNDYIGLVRIWINQGGPRIGMFGVLRTHRRRGITLASWRDACSRRAGSATGRQLPSTTKRTGPRRASSSASERGTPGAPWSSRPTLQRREAL